MRFDDWYREKPLLRSTPDDGIVVVAGRRKRDASMDPGTVPPALRERLGGDATIGLLEVLARSHEEERPKVISACTERFERRLVEEIAGVRVQIAQVETSLRTEIADTRAALRQEMAQMGASLRTDMAQIGASLRTEMAQMGASLRGEMAQMGASLRGEMAQMSASLRQDLAQMGVSIRQEIATGRVELFKWCFLFWIGQVMAVATIIGVMMRLFR